MVLTASPLTEDVMSKESLTTITKIRSHAAGIDVGAQEHWVCVDPGLCTQPIKRFGSFTEDLVAVVSWLVSLGIRSVAMEATGVYWRELYLRLEEAGLEVLLADPRTTRNPRGRKTDMQDCQWIWELHAHGLLDGAFVPGPEVQHLRSYVRLRDARVQLAGVAAQEMQRAMTLMNIKLQQVISRITGTTGMRIITAILAGERDPLVLAKLRDGRCAHDEATIAKALRGTWRSEHLFHLRTAHGDYEHHQSVIANIDVAIDALIRDLPHHGSDDTTLPKKASTNGNDFAFDARTASYLLCGVDLASIHGVGSLTALNLLGEVGFDLTAWPNAKAFCAWLGLCPNPKRSGGKHLGNLPTTANRAAGILRRSVISMDRQDGPLADFFRRISARKGRHSAIRATAHKIARIIYAMFRDRTGYDAKRLITELSEHAKRKILDRLTEKARALGMALVPQTPAGGVS